MLTVRVSDGGGGGGIYGDPTKVYFETGGNRIPLGGSWKFRVGRVDMMPDGQRVNKIPTVLYNAMLDPLQRLPIKGVLWYQGESNANNDAQAAAYRAQFETLIRSWRSEWSGGLGDFPFLWVQLPGFNPPDSVPPARSAWATHRESMNANLALPNTGQAIAIDLGDATDIHPTNKLDVGIRLARVALKSGVRKSRGRIRADVSLTRDQGRPGGDRVRQCGGWARQRDDLTDALAGLPWRAPTESSSGQRRASKAIA